MMHVWCLHEHTLGYRKMKQDELGQTSDNILLNSVINTILQINITLLLHEYTLGYSEMKLDELGQTSDNILLNSVINIILHINITLLLHEYSLGYRNTKLDELGQTSDNILLNSVINIILHINITLLLHEYTLGYRNTKLDERRQTSDNILFCVYINSCPESYIQNNWPKDILINLFCSMEGIQHLAVSTKFNFLLMVSNSIPRNSTFNIKRRCIQKILKLLLKY